MTSCSAWPGSQGTRPPLSAAQQAPGAQRGVPRAGFCARPSDGRPAKNISRENPRPDWRSEGPGGGRCKGGPRRPPPAHPRVRRDIPRPGPRRARQTAGRARSGSRAGVRTRTALAAPGPAPRSRASARPQVPPPACRNHGCRRRAQMHFPISRQARRRRLGLAG